MSSVELSVLLAPARDAPWMTIVWRYSGDRLHSETGERTAQRWVAGSFLLLVPDFLYESIKGCRALWRGQPDACCSPVGGCRGGLALPLLLERAAHVTAIDRAQDMVAAAEARHADDIAAGRLTVTAGDIGALRLADGSVDRILTVNTVYFWPDLAPAFGELRRVMAPGARLVIGIRDGSVMEHVDRDIFTLRTPAELANALRDAGLDDVDIVSAADRKSHLLAATNAR